MANQVQYIQSPFNKSRKDKFILVLNVPDGLKEISQKINRGNSTIIPDALQFSVYGVVVPDIEVPAVNVKHAGQTLTVSSHSRDPYPPVTVNFTVDNRFNNYWVIYKWLNLLNDSKINIYDKDNLTQEAKYTANDLNLKYRATISLYALDEYDKRIVEFTYSNAFPTALGGINFNNRDSTEIETFFTFSYSQLFVSLIDQIDSL